MPLTCLHCPSGLCAECLADYEEDPLTYLEFGAHPEGEENWRALQEEIAADARRREWPAPNCNSDDIPF